MSAIAHDTPGVEVDVLTPGCSRNTISGWWQRGRRQTVCSTRERPQTHPHMCWSVVRAHKKMTKRPQRHILWISSHTTLWTITPSPTYNSHCVHLCHACVHVSTHEKMVVLSDRVVHPRTKVVEAEHGAIGELVVLRGRGGQW